MIAYFRGRVRRIHFVGIGGIGMSGIAEVLLNLGFEVSGSDVRSSETTARLSQLGATFHLGHDGRHAGAADVVVRSSAVRDDNPELVAAHGAGIPVIPRAEMLAELMRVKYGVAIAGSHGKTTTTSLVASVLAHAGSDPTVVIGGKVNALGGNARLGQGPYLVAEADESDGSFLDLSPTVVVVTNIDPEHLDYWRGGLPEIQDAFVRFVNKVPFYGLAVLCLDHPGVQAVLPRMTRRHVTYGLSPQADYRAEKVRFDGLSMSFTVVRRGETLGDVQLQMVGLHNVINALAAVAVAEELGVGMDQITSGLAAFAGIARRFQVRADRAGITIVDDYGHHPAEIQAVLEAARVGFPDRRLVVAFQPHRYTRTRDLLSSFATCFNAAHRVVVTDIYAASEDPIAGIDGSLVADAVREHGHREVLYAPFAELTGALCNTLERGDVLLTLGAGDVWKIGIEVDRTLATAQSAAGGGPGE